MSNRTRLEIGLALRWLAAAWAVAMAAAPSAAAAGLFHRADPGRPLPLRKFIHYHTPHLPGDLWVRAGGELDPAGAVPVELTGPGLVVPSPAVLRNAWVVRTWGCPQVIGSEPWGGLAVYQFAPDGTTAPRPIADLWAAASGRPVVVVVTGNLSYGRGAENESLYSRWWLDSHGALPADALFVIFDWPAYRVIPLDPHDVDEKGRRGWVAGYHLARILQGFAPGTPVGLVGHSLGGRVVLTTLHLMGGGRIKSPEVAPRVALPADRPRDHLRLRAVAIADATDHQWLAPGGRLGRAVLAAEGILSLHNPIDDALDLYPLSTQSDHHLALGQVGLKPRDRRRLGPLSARVDELDISGFVGTMHTLPGAVVHPAVAARMAPYLFARGFAPVAP